MADEIKPQLKNLFVYIVILTAGLILVVILFSKNTNNSTVTQNQSSESAMIQKKTYPEPPKMSIDTGKKYLATLKTTKGEIAVELFAKETPNTVNNFVFLARDGFYDGTIFHRIIKGFMIQGGDPRGNGTGGPGYKLDDEKVTREYKRGIVAMANSGPNTNGSQFFIMHQDGNLPKNYVIFGQVTKGIETVDAIAETPVEANGQEQSKPKEEVKIEKVTVEEK